MALGERVDDDLRTIYTGNLITIGLTGLIAVAVYYVLAVVASAEPGVEFPVLLGLLTDVFTLIPTLGVKLIYFPYTGYLAWLAVSGGGGQLRFPVVFFVVTLVFVDVSPNFVVRSYVSKGELNMGLLLLTYVLGAVAFGWYGIFFPPIVLGVFVHFARDVLPVLLGSEPATRWRVADRPSPVGVALGRGWEDPSPATSTGRPVAGPTGAAASPRSTPGVLTRPTRGCRLRDARYRLLRGWRPCRARWRRCSPRRPDLRRCSRTGLPGSRGRTRRYHRPRRS